MPDNTHINIRRYQDEDLDSVQKLNILALGDVGVIPARHAHFDDLNDIENIYLENNGEFLVAYYGSSLIGMGGFLKIDTDTARLRRMRIHPDYQRYGLGLEILSLLEKSAIKMNYKKMILYTSEKLIGAQHFYSKHGYGMIDHDLGEGVIGYMKSLI